MTTVTYQDRLQSDLSLLSMVADSLVARPENFWRFDETVHSMSTAEAKEALQVLLRVFAPVPWKNMEKSAARGMLILRVRDFEAGTHVERLVANALRWGLSNHRIGRTA